MRSRSGSRVVMPPEQKTHHAVLELRQRAQQSPGAATRRGLGGDDEEADVAEVVGSPDRAPPRPRERRTVEYHVQIGGPARSCGCTSRTHREAGRCCARSARRSGGRWAEGSASAEPGVDVQSLLFDGMVVLLLVAEGRLVERSLPVVAAVLGGTNADGTRSADRKRGERGAESVGLLRCGCVGMGSARLVSAAPTSAPRSTEQPLRRCAHDRPLPAGYKTT